MPPKSHPTAPQDATAGGNNNRGGRNEGAVYDLLLRSFEEGRPASGMAARLAPKRDSSFSQKGFGRPLPGGPLMPHAP